MRGATTWLALACGAARAADVVETCAWNVHEATCAGPRAYVAQRAYYDEVVALDAYLRSVGAPPAEGHSAMCTRAVAHMRAVARAAGTVREREWRSGVMQPRSGVRGRSRLRWCDGEISSRSP